MLRIKFPGEQINYDSLKNQLKGLIEGDYKFFRLIDDSDINSDINSDRHVIIRPQDIICYEISDGHARISTKNGDILISSSQKKFEVCSIIEFEERLINIENRLNIIEDILKQQ